MIRFLKFLGDNAGAVTIDWVALTSGILLVGIMAIYAIYNNGASSAVDNANNMLTSISGETTLETVTIGGSTINGG